jgi:hypothetical protein
VGVENFLTSNRNAIFPAKFPSAIELDGCLYTVSSFLKRIRGAKLNIPSSNRHLQILKASLAWQRFSPYAPAAFKKRLENLEVF